MRGKWMWLAAVPVLVRLGAGMAGPSTAAGKIDGNMEATVAVSHVEAFPRQSAESSFTSPVNVPQGNGAPVITDGIEFAIRRSKFPGERWFMRLVASAIVTCKPGMLTYPAATAEKTTEGWLELRFK